jgi:predicted ester cyclase
MPVDQRDAAVRAYLDDVFNGHNLGSLDKYWIEDLVSHWMGDRSLHGLPAWREAMAGFFNAFPDAAYTLHDLFFSGDKGVWRGTWQATQRKDWEGIPATGRKATWTVIIIGRFEGEKLAEDWVEYDRYNLFRQLGAL